MSNNRILIIEDEIEAVKSIDLILRANNFFDVHSCTDPKDALKIVVEKRPDIVLLDLLMPHIDGRELISQILLFDSNIKIIITTAVNDIDTATACVRSGAYDYIVKPIDENRLFTSLKHISSEIEIKRINNTLKKTISNESLLNPKVFENALSQNRKMISIFHYLESIATSSYPVFITGEMGVGKKIFADIIHKLSKRNGNFVSFYLCGIEEDIVSETLFEHIECKSPQLSYYLPWML